MQTLDGEGWAALKAFQAGDISLGQLAKVLGKNKHETLALLGDLNVPFADYDLREDWILENVAEAKADNFWANANRIRAHLQTSQQVFSDSAELAREDRDA